MRAWLVAALALLFSVGSLGVGWTPALPVPSVQAEALGVVASLTHAHGWEERLLALAPYFDPGLEAGAPFREDRPVDALIKHIYARMGMPWSSEDQVMVQRQLSVLPAPLAHALQQLLGAIDVGMGDWQVAMSRLGPDDWHALEPAGHHGDQAMPPELRAALDKVDTRLIHASALRLLSVVDAVTPSLQAWQPDPRLNDCDLGIVPPGPNDCVWFRDPFDVILVGGLGSSTYQRNSWPLADIDPGERILILEPGGNDFYFDHAASAHPTPADGVCMNLHYIDCQYGFPVSVVLDLQGNDFYQPSSEVAGKGRDEGSVGHGQEGGIGVLVDLLGNDYYNPVWGQGAGNGAGGAVGILFDASGDDAYAGGGASQGVGDDQALGLLLDLTGNDVFYGIGALSQATTHWGSGILVDLGGNEVVTGSLATQGRAFGGGRAVFLNVGGSDTYWSREQSRGWAGTCWQYQGIQCPLGLQDFLAVFMDVCGTGRDQYLTVPGVDGTSWQQNSFGLGFDLNAPMVGCAAYE